MQRVVAQRCTEHECAVQLHTTKARVRVGGFEQRNKVRVRVGVHVAELLARVDDERLDERRGRIGNHVGGGLLSGGIEAAHQVLAHQRGGGGDVTGGHAGTDGLHGGRVGVVVRRVLHPLGALEGGDVAVRLGGDDALAGRDHVRLDAAVPGGTAATDRGETVLVEELRVSLDLVENAAATAAHVKVGKVAAAAGVRLKVEAEYVLEVLTGSAVLVEGAAEGTLLVELERGTTGALVPELRQCLELGVGAALGERAGDTLRGTHTQHVLGGAGRVDGAKAAQTLVAGAEHRQKVRVGVGERVRGGGVGAVKVGGLAPAEGVHASAHVVGDRVEIEVGARRHVQRLVGAVVQIHEGDQRAAGHRVVGRGGARVGRVRSTAGHADHGAGHLGAVAGVVAVVAERRVVGVEAAVRRRVGIALGHRVEGHGHLAIAEEAVVPVDTAVAHADDVTHAGEQVVGEHLARAARHAALHQTAHVHVVRLHDKVRLQEVHRRLLSQPARQEEQLRGGRTRQHRVAAAALHKAHLQLGLLALQLRGPLGDQHLRGLLETGGQQRQDAIRAHLLFVDGRLEGGLVGEDGRQFVLGQVGPHPRHLGLLLSQLSHLASSHQQVGVLGQVGREAHSERLLHALTRLGRVRRHEMYQELMRLLVGVLGGDLGELVVFVKLLGGARVHIDVRVQRHHARHLRRVQLGIGSERCRREQKANYQQGQDRERRTSRGREHVFLAFFRFGKSVRECSGCCCCS
mmetsp:Transcript_14930/g.44722  ORF Transcript_14930/g.44722 Transcript_14930/m.44722 type:complete len:743 (+) Transcript_14930:972-3200(+)